MMANSTTKEIIATSSYRYDVTATTISTDNLTQSTNDSLALDIGLLTNGTNGTTNTTLWPPVTSGVFIDFGPTVLAMALILIATASLTMNTLILIIFGRGSHSRKRVFYFMVELAAFDCSATCLWTVLTIVQMLIDHMYLGDPRKTWLSLTGVICMVQAYTMSIVALVNMYTLFVMSFERCVRLVKPSKHHEIFGGNKTVTAVIMLTVFLYCFTITIFPLLGFGSMAEFVNQYQCSWNFEVSSSHQNFLFVVGFVLPLTGSIVCHVICIFKAKKISGQVHPGETMVIEENKDIPQLTYAQKLKKMENKFKYSHQKMKKRKGKERIRKDSSDSSSDSDEDEAERRYKEKQRKKQKRLYKFKHDDFKLAVSFIVITFLNFFCWLPYFIVGYIWVVPGYSTVSDAVFAVVIFLCHFTTILKPIVYLTNARLRHFARQALSRRQTDNLEGKDYRKEQTETADNDKVNGHYPEDLPGSRRSSVSSSSKERSEK